MPTKITIRDSGPLLIDGDITLCDAKGGEYDLAGKTVHAFCRCGESQNKPFCDGSHKTAGFSSECEAHSLGSD